MSFIATIVADGGLDHLFILSFLASTLLPIGSEWYLILLLLQDLPPGLLVLVATTGNWLGALTNYVLGRWGADYFANRFLEVDETRLEKARRMYQKYGSWSLLLSWLPVVGDPICLLGGLMKVNIIRFSILVLLGKGVRYTAVAYLTLLGTKI